MRSAATPDTSREYRERQRNYAQSLQKRVPIRRKKKTQSKKRVKPSRLDVIKGMLQGNEKALCKNMR